MKRATFTVLFYIKRTKKKKDGTAPVFVRLTVNGLRAEFALQKSINEDQWNKEKGCVEGAKINAKKFNLSLDLVKNKLYGHKLEIEEEGKEVTAARLKNAYLGIEEDPKTILGVFSDHNEWFKSLIGIDFAKGTWQRYEACYNHIERFIQYKYKKSDVTLRDVNPIFIRDLEHYLKTERHCAHNSTLKYLRHLKKIIRIALANGWLKSDPFANIKFHFEEVDMDFLTEEELNTVMSQHFQIERLQQVKDIYLFCCFTGLAFVDIKSLLYSDIEMKDGTYWIKKRRQKTKNWCHIPMLN